MAVDRTLSDAGTTVRTTGGSRWFLVRNHPVLSTRFRDVVLSTARTMVLSSSKEEERESYAIALSALLFSRGRTKHRTPLAHRHSPHARTGGAT